MNAKDTQKTLLVVDDDALITMNTVDLLTDLGYAAIEAYSAADALKRLADTPTISAMMTDYSMPGMTGLELAQAAQEMRPGLPVLLVTGYAELPDSQQSELPRLEKPYSAADLGSALDTLLGA